VWQQAAKQGRVAGRVVVKQGRSFLHHVVPAITKPLTILWNEVIGFLFLCMGTVFGFLAYRSLHSGDVFRGLVASACSAIMLWFGISSFWRARKISRS
jgi:vacuolar-type H+-ATPase subunit I/STV1